MLKYTLSPLLCWSKLYHRCCVEVHSITAVVLSTLYYRCCVELHSITAVVLKYTLSPMLCWSTLYHRCCVEARRALCDRYGRGTQAEKRQRAGRATDSFLLLLPDLSPWSVSWSFSLTCFLLLLPDLSPWPVSCSFSLTWLPDLSPDPSPWRKCIS